MKEEFNQLISLLNQAKQNFNYAESDYVESAIYQLKNAESLIDAFIKEHRYVY